MAWNLVIIYFYYKYKKQILVSGCSIMIIALIILYNYFGREYKTYDNNVLVTSDRVLSDYDVGNDYYVYYEDIKTNLHGKDIFINMSFSICDDIDNVFEVIVPYEYRMLFNKKINIEINNYIYSFYVVDVYKDNFNNNFIYTNSDTMDIIYKNSFDLDEYTYRFVVDDYSSLNSSLDILSFYGYDLSIKLNKDLVDLSNYDSIMSLIPVFILFFLLVILIILI